MEHCGGTEMEAQEIGKWSQHTRSRHMRDGTTQEQRRCRRSNNGIIENILN